MIEYTPQWKGLIRGYCTNGRDPWQVYVELPEGPGIYGGTGPTVEFARGQVVHVLTDEGLAEVERAAAEAAWTAGAHAQWRLGQERRLSAIPDNPYLKTKEESDDQS